MPAPEDPTTTLHPAAPLEGAVLEQQLERIAEHLARREGNPAGELAALLPSEPVTGASVVACWRAGEDVSYEVVRLADGAPVSEPASIREAFTLLAMAEELESALDRDGLLHLADMAAGLFAPGGPAVGDEEEAPAASEASAAGGADPQHEALRAPLVAGLGEAEAHLRSLAELAPEEGTPRVASAILLDRIGGELAALERTWERLARAAQAWANAAHAQEPARVEQLWQVLGAVHRGPLAVPPSVLVQRGREAGKALCDDVLAPG